MHAQTTANHERACVSVVFQYCLPPLRGPLQLALPLRLVALLVPFLAFINRYSSRVLFALVGEQCVRRLVPSSLWEPDYQTMGTSRSLVLLLYYLASSGTYPYESSNTERIPASKQIKKWIVDFERLVSYSYPGLPPFWSLI